MDKDRYQIIVLYNVNYYYVTSIIAHTKKKKPPDGSVWLGRRRKLSGDSHDAA